MADRYWVGGTGTWDDTSTTVWSTTSGGSSGASVPTSADDVFFDQAGPYTVTTAVSERPCKSITVSGANVSFSLAFSVRIFGNVTFHSTTVWDTATPGVKANLVFANTGSPFASTVTTNGVTVGSLFGNFAQITLGSDYVGGTISTFLAGSSFDTAGYSITMGSWTPGATFDGVWNWRGSQITMTTGTITCTNGTMQWASTPQAFFNCTNTGAGTQNISMSGGGRKIIPRMNVFPGTTNSTIVIGSNAESMFYDFSCNGATAKTFSFAQTTRFQSFNLRGTSTKLFSIATCNSSGTATPGTQQTLTKPGSWYVGANSTNVSNNTNLTFTAGGNIDWLSIRDINGSAVSTGNFFPFMR